ncbi:hypothetical protein [Colwellia sp. UCD-KL20]|uniref:hypothetical protein n=1 Tax=Colwellia sp. UCD-KL20 TaxID=1917165 RepID=UPI0009710CD4|nr:hypothetical protein [Colwellia sp. UCD-KL20]
MAANKKKTRKTKKNTKVNSSIKSFLRTADLNSNPFRGVSKARLNTETKDFHLIIRKLLESDKYKKTVLNAPFPKLEQLSDDREQLSFAKKEKIFIWTACVLSYFVKEISEFVKIKNEYENNYIFAKYDKAKNNLDEIEEKFNISMWLINSRIEFYQRTDSLQKQKDFLEQIVSIENIDPVVAFFANFFSSRNEDNTTNDSYINDVENIINLNNIGSYANYHLLPFCISNIVDTSKVLSYEEDNSVIDRYEALVSMLEVEASKADFKSAAFIKSVIRILSNIEDPRLYKLEVIFGLSNELQGQNELTIYDHYTLGNYNSEIPQSVNNLELIVRQALFSKDKLECLKAQDSIFSTVAYQMALMLSKTGDYNESKIVLEKIRLTVARTSLASHITHFLLREDHFFINKERSEAENLFALSLSLDNPWIISTVESIYPIKSFRETLLSLFPNSCAVKLQKYMTMGYDESCCLVEEENLPKYREQLYLGVLAHKSAKYDEADAHFNMIDVSTNPYLESQVSENKINNLMAQNKVFESIEIVVEHFFSNPSSISSYPIKQLLGEMEKETKVSDEAYQSINYCVFLSIASRNIHPKWERNLSDIYENIIELSGVSKPSELRCPSEYINSKKLIYLLRYVAIPRILDDCIFFDGVDEVEDERIAICQLLLELDPENTRAYSSEIKALTKEAKITQLVNHVNASKIYVNEGAVISHVQQTISRLFRQYISLLEVPELNIQVDKISERLKDLLNSGEFENFGIPASERIGLFESMYKMMINELAANPAFGLEPHINTTIKHGSFEGQVRRAFDQQEILITKSKGSPRERLPDKWKNNFKANSDAEIKKLMVRLDLFTKKTTDIIVFYLDELLQIKTVHNNGLFVFVSTKAEIEELRKFIKVSSSYDDFLNLCITRFWFLMDKSMNNIRNKIQKDLKPSLTKALDTMSSGISLDLKGNDSHIFHDAIVKSKIDFERYMEDLCGWFTKPDQQLMEAFNFDLIFSVALKQIHNCYVASPLICTEEITVDSSFKGKYFASVVEVLFMLLQNVIRHSYQENLKANLSVTVNGSVLTICLENSLGKEVDLDTLKENIEQFNEQYSSGSSDSSVELANKKSGSGLSKIWRILEHDLNVSHSLYLSLSEEEIYSAKLEFDIKELIYED